MQGQLQHRGAQALLLLPVFPTRQQEPTAAAEHHKWERVPLLREAFNKTMEVAHDSADHGVLVSSQSPTAVELSAQGCSALTSCLWGFHSIFTYI